MTSFFDAVKLILISFIILNITHAQPGIAIGCGERRADFYPLTDVWFFVIIPFHTETVRFSACKSDFDTILELYDESQTNLIASDDDGCGLPEGQSEIITLGLNADFYSLKLSSKLGPGIEGIYDLEMFCSPREPTTTSSLTTTEQPTTSDLSTSILTSFDLTTTEESTTDLSTSFSTTFECGHNRNSGPGKAIQCTSDEDCCDGFSCRTKDGPKKGKCGRDKRKSKGKHKKHSGSSAHSKSKSKKKDSSSDDKQSMRKNPKKSDSSDESEGENAVVNNQRDISSSEFDNNARNNNISWIILVVGVSIIFCIMCVILICYKQLFSKRKMNKNKYDTVSIIVSK